MAERVRGVFWPLDHQRRVQIRCPFTVNWYLTPPACNTPGVTVTKT
jgi:hypothetical protein